MDRFACNLREATFDVATKALDIGHELKTITAKNNTKWICITEHCNAVFVWSNNNELLCEQDHIDTNETPAKTTVCILTVCKRNAFS
jgi:hypothetical protein